MLSYRPADWRNGLHGPDSAWYKSLTQFRQDEPLKWRDTIERVAECVADIADPQTAASGRQRHGMSVPKSYVEGNPIKIGETRYGPMSFYATDHYVGHSLDLYGDFSLDEAEFFKQVVKPGDMVVEIGANIGALTLPLVDIVGESGFVYAFEANPQAFDLLEQNVDRHDRVRAVKCVLGPVRAMVGIKQQPLDRINNLGGTECEPDPNGQHEMKPLDDFTFPCVNFIKVDVEGMAEEVLLGARETIKKYRPLLYVEDDRPENSATLRTLLRQMGYRLYTHNPHLYSAENFKGYKVNVFGDVVSANLFCVPKERYDLREITRNLPRA
jgi:FkbM family methyltransferase